MFYRLCRVGSSACKWAQRKLLANQCAVHKDRQPDLSVLSSDLLISTKKPHMEKRDSEPSATYDGKGTGLTVPASSHRIIVHGLPLHFCNIVSTC